MSRINTNITSLIAQRVLNQQNNGLSQTLERLSTGLAINRGADNPSGLIASEKLRSEKANLTQALSNAERADQVANIAEGGLQEISSQLTQLQALVNQSANTAGLSATEKDANQQQIDSILQTIDRIASTTSFAGTKLLNGGYDFVISGQSAKVAGYQINGANAAHGTNVDVKAIVTASAQHAALWLSTGGDLDLSAATARFTFELAGQLGSRSFSFASGTKLSAVAASINTFKSVTGVSAKNSGTGLMVKSTDFGSDQFVSFKLVNRAGQNGSVVQVSSINENVKKTTGTAFTAVTNTIRDEGKDVTATINGMAARGKGKTVSINTDSLDLSIELTTSGAQISGGAAAAAISAFTITGGGAKFQLGSTIDTSNQVRLGIQNVASRNLGSSTLGYLDQLGSGKTYNLVSGNLETGQKIVDKAIDQVSTLRSRLGSFQRNVVGSTINALGVALENTSAAESAIRDTNFAKETANLTRSQILVSAASTVLATANAQPQNVLRLLG